jgi:cation transport protein ChaC
MEPRVAALRRKALGAFSAQLGDADLWVFGYGSLMWNPGFHFVRRQPARLYGFHRALCIHSTAHRGTPDNPGLVLGLAPGGSCHGMAFLVPRREVTRTLLALWQREMRDRSYHPRLVDVRFGARGVRALAFVVDRTHEHYAGELPEEEIARRLVSCRGERGANIDYFMNTVAHLHALGVHDRRLAAAFAAVRALLGSSGPMTNAHAGSTASAVDRVQSSEREA